MEHYVPVSESASLCVVDATGRIVREAKVASEPEVLIGWFRGLGIAVTRNEPEAGPARSPDQERGAGRHPRRRKLHRSRYR